MGALTEKENEWLDQATAAAVAGARKIASSSGPLVNTPIGRLGNHEWGMIVTAAIFGWVELRVQQAIAEGRDSEQMVRLTGLSPSPCDVAVVRSILPVLADEADIDWTLPLTAWSSDTMTSFLLLAWRLLGEAETVRDHGPGKILKRAEFDERTGDPIPFDLGGVSSENVSRSLFLAEVWRDVPSAPGILVSNEGRVMMTPYRGPMPDGHGTRSYGGKPTWGAWHKQNGRDKRSGRFIIQIRGIT
jgi:hypothetical protein